MSFWMDPENGDRNEGRLFLSIPKYKVNDVVWVVYLNVKIPGLKCQPFPCAVARRVMGVLAPMAGVTPSIVAISYVLEPFQGFMGQCCPADKPFFESELFSTLEEACASVFNK